MGQGGAPVGVDLPPGVGLGEAPVHQGGEAVAAQDGQEGRVKGAEERAGRAPGGRCRGGGAGGRRRPGCGQPADDLAQGRGQARLKAEGSAWGGARYSHVLTFRQTTCFKN